MVIKVYLIDGVFWVLWFIFNSCCSFRYTNRIACEVNEESEKDCDCGKMGETFDQVLP